MNQLERMIKAYIAIREQRSVNKREFEETDADLKKKLELIEGHLLKAMNESGSDQLKVAGVGMAVKSKKFKANARDWAAITEYIIKSGDLELLQRRLALNAVRSYADEHDGQLPPGVDLTTEIAVQVRRN